MIYLGIDPGQSGCIAALWSDGGAWESHCPGDSTEGDIVNWIRNIQELGDGTRACIEIVHSSPQMGVTSAFTFGRSYGLLRGIVLAHKIPLIEVRPQKWQKAMGCMSKGDKNVTKAAAQRLWPSVKITHRNADALLIAEYGRKFGW
jgi:Holliday junction resolvasome RuvABC endonuclease subunit